MITPWSYLYNQEAGHLHVPDCISTYGIPPSPSLSAVQDHLLC